MCGVCCGDTAHRRYKIDYIWQLGFMWWTPPGTRPELAAVCPAAVARQEEGAGAGQRVVCLVSHLSADVEGACHCLVRYTRSL